MDNNDLLNHDLQVTPQVHSYLIESAKWGKFLSIIGFIFCGVMILLAFILPGIYSQMPATSPLVTAYGSGLKTALTVAYLLLALLFFFPCLYLYKFSVKMQTAMLEINQENFDESFMNLKSIFKFYGIFTIIILSIYALVFIIGIVAVAMR